MYLREVMGVNIKGDAWTIKPNIPFESVLKGDVVLLSYSKVEHAAVVLNISTKEGIPTLLIAEANYKKCKPTVRQIPWDDPAIRGYYHPAEAVNI